MSRKSKRNTKNNSTVDTGVVLTKKQEALFDLVESMDTPKLKDMNNWTCHQLVCYLKANKVDDNIIFRCYDGNVTGSVFITMGKKKKNKKGERRWAYFAKVGINDYYKLDELNIILEEYEDVCDRSIKKTNLDDVVDDLDDFYDNVVRVNTEDHRHFRLYLRAFAQWLLRKHDDKTKSYYYISKFSGMDKKSGLADTKLLVGFIGIWKYYLYINFPEHFKVRYNKGKGNSTYNPSALHFKRGYLKTLKRATSQSSLARKWVKIWNEQVFIKSKDCKQYGTDEDDVDNEDDDLDLEEIDLSKCSTDNNDKVVIQEQSKTIINVELTKCLPPNTGWYAVDAENVNWIPELYNFWWDENTKGNQLILAQHKTMPKTEFYMYHVKYGVFRSVSKKHVIFGPKLNVSVFKKYLEKESRLDQLKKQKIIEKDIRQKENDEKAIILDNEIVDEDDDMSMNGNGNNNTSYYNNRIITPFVPDKSKQTPNNLTTINRNTSSNLTPVNNSNERGEQGYKPSQTPVNNNSQRSGQGYTPVNNSNQRSGQGYTPSQTPLNNSREKGGQGYTPVNNNRQRGGQGYTPSQTPLNNSREKSGQGYTPVNNSSQRSGQGYTPSQTPLNNNREIGGQGYTPVNNSSQRGGQGYTPSQTPVNNSREKGGQDYTPVNNSNETSGQGYTPVNNSQGLQLSNNTTTVNSNNHIPTQSRAQIPNNSNNDIPTQSRAQLPNNSNNHIPTQSRAQLPNNSTTVNSNNPVDSSQVIMTPLSSDNIFGWKKEWEGGPIYQKINLFARDQNDELTKSWIDLLRRTLPEQFKVFKEVVLACNTGSNQLQANLLFQTILPETSIVYFIPFLDKSYSKKVYNGAGEQIGWQNYRGEVINKKGKIICKASDKDFIINYKEQVDLPPPPTSPKISVNNNGQQIKLPNGLNNIFQKKQNDIEQYNSKFKHIDKKNKDQLVTMLLVAAPDFDPKKINKMTKAEIKQAYIKKLIEKFSKEKENSVTSSNIPTDIENDISLIGNDNDLKIPAEVDESFVINTSVCSLDIPSLFNSGTNSNNQQQSNNNNKGQKRNNNNDNNPPNKKRRNDSYGNEKEK